MTKVIYIFKKIKSNCPELLTGKDELIKKKKLSMTKKDSFKIGRDAETGKFIPVEKAKRRPKTTTIETIPKKK